MHGIKTVEGPVQESGSASSAHRPATRPVKSHYSEVEAAEELGVTVTQLRTMIRSHVVDREEDLTNVPVTTFQASDLLILRLLAGMPPTPSRD